MWRNIGAGQEVNGGDAGGRAGGRAGRTGRICWWCCAVGGAVITAKAGEGRDGGGVGGAVDESVCDEVLRSGRFFDCHKTTARIDLVCEEKKWWTGFPVDAGRDVTVHRVPRELLGWGSTGRTAGRAPPGLRGRGAEGRRWGREVGVWVATRGGEEDV